MKKLSFFVVSMMMLAAPAWAQSNTGKVLSAQPKLTVDQLVQQGIDVNDVTHLADANTVEGLFSPEKKPAKRVYGVGDVRNNTKKMRRADEGEGTVKELFAVAQSYHEGYTFNYNGGDVFTYKIGIERDGTKVTLTNLFDMEVQSAGSYAVSKDLPVEGVYDEEAKTITIPSETVCGDYGGWYDAILRGGTVSQNGQLTPSAEIVFDVEGDLERITAREAIAATYTYGTIRIYKSFTAAVAKTDEAKLMTFVEDMDFGEAYVGTTTERTIKLINTGGMDADFAIELEADGDAYTVLPEAGTVPAMGTLDLVFSMKQETASEYEGIATLTYDNGTDEESLVFSMIGTVIEYPDYTPIIKQGEMTFKTSSPFPFEMTQLEDGTPVAQSGAHGAYGNSQLDVFFTVPEGKLATFAWKGMSNNSSYWYQCAGGYFIDDMNTAAKSYTGANEDISGSVELAPGDHQVRFQYDGYYYTGLEDNKMYVYDLELTFADLQDNAAEVTTPEVALGNFILKEESVTGTGEIVLRNKGANELKVTKVTSDNPEFNAIPTSDGVATLQYLTIPVEFTATVAGEKVGNLTIETTAGTYQAVMKASVMDMPDYASIVTEGLEYMTFTANEQYPFIVEDGKAWNKNCDEPNDVMCRASFKVAFTIPEGKIGHFAWDGEAWGDAVNNNTYCGVDMYDAPRMTSGSAAFYNKGDGAAAGSDDLDDLWKQYTECIAGDHSFEFYYYKSGMGEAPEGNKYVVSNIRLVLEDFEKYNAELDQDEVTFKETYVGPQRYTTATVTLKNTGSEPLVVNEITGDEPFYGIVPTGDAKFGNSLTVELWFYPAEKGEFTGDLTLQTTAGDFVVHCSGNAKDYTDEGIIMLGDFEDDAYNWTILDSDGDGSSWNLGTNMWGTYYEDGYYTHAGAQCLASASDWYTPDNWTFSPAIAIPAEGADLSYWVAAFSPYNWLEHYSFYVAEDVTDIEAVKAAGALLEETMEEAQGARDGWVERTFSLDDYAGKTIYLCFRHHDTEGQYLLRLDDVIVREKGGNTGINSAANAYNATSREVYSASGMRLGEMQNGLNIVRKQMEDGSVKTIKVVK